MRIAFIFVIAAFVVSLAAWLICWSLLPNVIVTHWNLGARFQFTYFILPAIGIFIVTTLIGVLPLLKAEVTAAQQARQTLPRTIWFPAKRYGWGWGFPCAWQGWAVMILWLAGLFGGLAAIATLARNDLKLSLFFPFILTMIAILSVVCYLKGEKPRWRWGDDRQ